MGIFFSAIEQMNLVRCKLLVVFSPVFHLTRGKGQMPSSRVNSDPSRIKSNFFRLIKNIFVKQNHKDKR